ncbi:MAG: TetR/AcrR family transcriptional regulator [Alphaproteobacteria bacterium]
MAWHRRKNTTWRPLGRKNTRGASTTDIADRLGIRQGSLYYYFASKEAALEVVCHKGVEGFTQGPEEVLKGATGTTRRLAALALLGMLNGVAPWYGGDAAPWYGGDAAPWHGGDAAPWYGGDKGPGPERIADGYLTLVLAGASAHG